MTVKKRLFLSNILMLAVPVFITALIALGCVGAIWFTFTHGTGIGFEDSVDFYRASAGISLLAEKSLRSEPDQRLSNLNSISSFLDRGSMSLEIISGGTSYYTYGRSDEEDSELLKAVAVLGNEGTASGGGRSLLAHNVNVGGTDYLILIFGSETELSYGTLKLVVVAAAVILMITIVFSIWITDRFLIKFIFKKIEEPLDILSYGVRQIQEGNLDYHIEYAQKDEFAPICADFNKMALRLKASVELAQQDEQSRKELMAGISHDLRTPLTSIQAYVEGLLDGVAKTPEMQRAYLETIKSKAEDIARMVTQIFMFSKMQLGKYPDNPIVLRLDNEISQLVQTIKEEYAEKGLQIKTDLNPVTVFADPEQLHRVLINIIENSLKYKDKETGELVITLSITENGCCLSLRDDGPGVPEVELPRLFDAFYRSDPARQNPNKGSGLGLSIAERAVRRMNGTVMARNVESGGLDIIIELPKVGREHE